jgi:hypothetical protein
VLLRYGETVTQSWGGVGGGVDVTVGVGVGVVAVGVGVAVLLGVDDGLELEVLGDDVGLLLGFGLLLADGDDDALELEVLVGLALEVRVVGLALEVLVAGLALEARVVGLAEVLRLGDDEAVGLALIVAVLDTVSIPAACDATMLAATVGRVWHGLALSRTFRPWPVTPAPAAALAAIRTRKTPSAAV